MNNHIASPKALGFGVLGILLWMISVGSAGISNSPMVAAANGGSTVLPVIAAVAMLGLLIAGLAAFLRSERWLAFFFLLWAGLAWGAGHAGGIGTLAHGNAGFRDIGWFFMTLALVNFYLWFAAMKNARLGGAVSLVVLFAWLAMLALGLRFFFDFWVLIRVGGALGLASGLAAFYVSARAAGVDYRRGVDVPGEARDAPPVDDDRPPL